MRSLVAVYTAQWVYTVEFYWYCSKIALLWASLFAPPSRSQRRRWPDRSIYLSESSNPWEASLPKNEWKKRGGDGRVSETAWSPIQLIVQKWYYSHFRSMKCKNVPMYQNVHLKLYLKHNPPPPPPKKKKKIQEAFKRIAFIKWHQQQYEKRHQ